MSNEVLSDTFGQQQGGLKLEVREVEKVKGNQTAEDPVSPHKHADFTHSWEAIAEILLVMLGIDYEIDQLKKLLNYVSKD